MRAALFRLATGRNILILFVLTMAVYAAMLFITIPGVLRHADGMTLPDLMPGGYEPQYIRQLFSELGDEGRGAYLRRQLPLDLVYPFLFALSNALILVYLLLRLGKATQKALLIATIPLAAGLFDYLENISTICMLLRYPDISDVSVRIASVFTVLKSGLTTLFFILLLALLLALLLHHFRSGKKARSSIN
jgi:hypothetical protein